MALMTNDGSDQTDYARVARTHARASQQLLGMLIAELISNGTIRADFVEHVRANAFDTNRQDEAMVDTREALEILLSRVDQALKATA